MLTEEAKKRRNIDLNEMAIKYFGDIVFPHSPKEMIYKRIQSFLYVVIDKWSAYDCNKEPKEVIDILNDCRKSLKELENGIKLKNITILKRFNV